MYKQQRANIYDVRYKPSSLTTIKLITKSIQAIIIVHVHL